MENAYQMMKVCKIVYWNGAKYLHLSKHGVNLSNQWWRFESKFGSKADKKQNLWQGQQELISTPGSV